MLTLKDLGQEELLELLEYVKELRSTGLSYSKIAKRIAEERGVKVSKTTVLRWCKGKHNPFGKIKVVNLKPSPPLAYIVGVYFGDGSISLNDYKYRIRLKVVDKEFAEAFAEALREIGTNPQFYEESDGRRKRFVAEATSKSLYKFLEKPKEELFEVAKAYPREFLKGFFDSEGYVYLDPKTKKISYVSVWNYELELLEFSQGLLSCLGIHSKIRASKKAGSRVLIRGEQYSYKKNLYELRIYRVESVRRFAKEVGFTISRKQNKLREWLLIKFNEHL